MRNVLLQFHDDADIDGILSVLKPYGDTVDVKPLAAKIVPAKRAADRADWLGKVYCVDTFKPMTREELYVR